MDATSGREGRAVSPLAAWVLAVSATLVAAVLAAADSALLAFHASDASTTSKASFSERERAHRALSMGRVLAFITAGAALAEALPLPAMSPGARVLSAALAAIVICTIAEGVGRAVGYSDPPTMQRRLAPITEAASVLLSPAVALGAAIDRGLHAIIPPPAVDDEERETSAEQFAEVVAAEAEVSSAEEELIHGVFSLGATTVEEIMVPRVDIVGIDAATPWSEVLDRIRVSEHARLPVYRDTLDDVTGVLYAKDVLPAIVADEEPPTGWLSLARPPVFIPVSKRIDGQLRDFQASRTHMAIVSDEYGGTAGLVTIEDILEEIVGEIRDEYDVEEPEIQQEGTRRYWVSGRVPVDELAERLGTEFDVEDVTTVGGLVYALFGRVPKSGETLMYGGFKIVVERVHRRRIERVYFARLEPAPTPERE